MTGFKNLKKSQRSKRWRDSLLQWAAAVATALALVVVPACGGGGGGGGGGGMPPPTQPTTGITFTPSGGTANGISLARQGMGTTTLAVEVRANGIDPVFGLSYDLVYPSNLFTFDGAQEGGFLAGGGASTSLLLQEVSPGRLVVGHTRLGAVGSIGGSGVLLTLNFTATASGSGSFAFEDSQAIDEFGNPQTQISFGSATVEVRL